jgi:Homeodomain-like domain
MRRTEAEEAVRMARFLTLLHRWESAELNQEEAAELLGVSERTFRRWTRRSLGARCGRNDRRAVDRHRGPSSLPQLIDAHNSRSRGGEHGRGVDGDRERPAPAQPDLPVACARGKQTVLATRRP